MAGDRTVAVRLRAEVAGYRSGMAQAKQATEQVVDSTKKLDKAQIAQAAAEKKAAAEAAAAARQAEQARVARNQALADVGGVMMKVGAAGALGIGLAVKSFADFDQAMSNVKATGSDAAANMDKLRATAMQLGADTQFSATEAAAGIENLLKAGVSAQDVMGGGLKGALDLAAAGEISVADAAEIAATAMTQFKLKGTDVPHIADLLAAGAGKAQGEVSDMAAALNQSGLQAAAFGLSIEETTGTLAAFASAGLIGSDAGTSFKTMLQRLSNPTKESAALMKKLGIDMYDSKGKFIGVAGAADELKSSMSKLTPEQRQAAMATIFGSDAVRAANVLYEQGGKGIKEWTSAVNEQGYASKSAATKMDNLKGDLEQLGGAFETAMIKIGGNANGPLRGLVQSITEAVNAFANLSGPQQEAIFKTAAFGSAGLLAVGGIMKTVSAVSNFKSSLSTLFPHFSRASSGAKSLGGAADGVAGKIGKAGSSAERSSGSIKKIGDRAMVAAKVGVAALIGGLGALETAMSGPTQSAETVAANMEALSKAGASTVQVNGQVAQSMSGFHNGLMTWGYDINNVGDAMQYLQNTSKNGSAAVQGVVDAALGWTGVKSTVGALREEFGKMDASLAGMSRGGNTAGAAAAFSKIAAEAQKSGISVEQAAGYFPEYRSELERIAAQLGGVQVSAGDMAAWMGGQVPSSIRAAAAANPALVAGLSASQRAMLQTRDAAGQIPKKIEMTLSAPGMMATKAEASQLAAAVKQIPRAASVRILAPGARPSKAEVDAFMSTVKGIPKEKRAAIRTVAEFSGVVEARRQVEWLHRVAADKGRSKIQLQAKIDGAKQVAAQIAGIFTGANRIPKSKTTRVSAPGATAAAAQMNATRGAAGKIPAAKSTRVSAPGATGATSQMNAARGAANRIPGAKATRVSAPGATSSTGQVNNLRSAIARTNGKSVTVAARVQGIGAVQSLVASIRGVVGRTVSVVTNVVRRFIGAPAQADGGILQSRQGRLYQKFADGGMASFRGQQPQIRAAGGAGVIWAEDGAGPWEAFISGHPNKKQRSRSIADDVVARLGGQITWTRYADGGVHQQPGYVARGGIVQRPLAVSFDEPALRRAVSEGLAGSTVYLEMDGRLVDARIRTAFDDLARRMG